MDKFDQAKVIHIRNSACGYVGGQDIADLATNEEILLLCNIQDIIANLHNRLDAQKMVRDKMFEHIRNRTTGE